MPRSVWWFEKLMWPSLLLGCVVAWFDWDRIRKMQEAAGHSYPVINTMSAFAITLALVYFIARARRDYRWILAALIVFVLDSPVSGWTNPAADARSNVQLVTNVQFIVQFVALGLVLWPSARQWFARPADSASAT